MIDGVKVVKLPVRGRARWERFKVWCWFAGRALLFFWHETFGCHDHRVTRTGWENGRRLLWMECDCGAEWDAIEPGEELGL